jgi:hypothetical protein
LVVPVRGLGTVPGKILQATPHLTLRHRNEGANFNPCNLQPLNGIRTAGSRSTRSCVAGGLSKPSNSIELY